MLVANPGQTPYTLITKKSCHNKPAKNNAVIGLSTKYSQSSSTTITQFTSTVVSTKTMAAVATIPPRNETNSLKTASVRINRETDLLKHTVQKALMSKIPSHLTSVLNLYTVPPTNAHRYPERTESLSVDSLRTEMCYFKPIRTVPMTPNKRSKAVVIKIPNPRLALKENQDCDAHERPQPSSHLTSIALPGPRISAFSYVALLHKSSTTIQGNQKHKAKNKTSQSYRKTNEENLDISKCCVRQAGILVKSIDATTSVDKEIKEDEVTTTTTTSVKHRTRGFSKTSSMRLIAEPQITNKTTRLTRKRQQMLENVNNVRTKNVKLSKDCSNSTKGGKKKSSARGSRCPSRRTPPVTRSRLKQSMILTRKQYQHQHK